jgi:PST family polysaccharide transporter
MTLRDEAMRGGAHLIGRELFGLLIRFGGALLVTRLIGPSDFGLYAGALAIVTVLATAAQLGGEVFLIRREHEPPRRMYDEVFTTLLLSTGAAVVLGLVGSFVVGAIIDRPSAVAAFQVLLLTLPLGVMWAPAQAMLERAFSFRAMAYLQVGSDATLYSVAVVLAVAGAGVWAPIAGTFASLAFLLVGSYTLASYRPRIELSRARVLELGRFAVEFTPAGLVWTAVPLVNPLVVGTFLGSASVGYVALATRLVDTASFVERATYRVSLVALSRVQGETDRLRRGFEEMLTLRAIGVGGPLAVLCIVAPFFIPTAFGEEWEPALDVLPFVSVSYLIGAVWSTHVALLYVLGRQVVATMISLLQFVLLAAAALVLVPSLELIGYGGALLVASTAWVFADLSLRKHVDFDYGLAARWIVALTPPLFIPLLDTPWAITLLAPVTLLLAFDRVSRSQLWGYAGFLRRHLRRSEVGLDEPM